MIRHCSVLLCFILVLVAAQTEDPFDEAHRCQMWRQCMDCSHLEFCVKWSSTYLQRWWLPCPADTPYCNPFSQRCEATITPICQTLTGG